MIPTPCTAAPELWFSTKPQDQAEAVTACGFCPLRKPCTEYATAQNIPWGTWGGLTEKDRRRQARRARSASEPECRTHRAIQKHRRRKETCIACQAWWATVLEADRRHRLADEHAKGGSLTGYQIHRRLGERPCARCRTVNRLASQQRRDRATAT
ncbi:WhiB family transcriptional regulator [Streptomyces sp. NPDC048057]|uniref:WhiB family transcriptional regulator n=1 Tax=Streptomyces sp. NPDC048057 TaxID=3155628 RepID=UPI0033ED66EE